MDILFYLLLPAILAIGIITSYEDMKYGKIRNKWITASIVYAIAAIILAIVIIIVSGGTIMASYITDFITNILFSTIFGFVIWHFGVLSGGDSKLFIAYSFLVPLSIYTNGYIRFFPSFTIIVNTSLIVLFFLLLNIILKNNMREKITAIKNIDKRLIIKPIVSMFGLSWVIRIAFSAMGIQYDAFTFFMIVPVIYYSIERFIGKRMEKVYIILAPARILLDYNYILSIGFVYYFMFIVIFYVIISFLLMNMSYDTFSMNIGVHRLKPGMMPAEILYKHNDKYKRMGMNAVNREKEITNPESLFNTKKLTADDIKTLRNLANDKKICPTLRVYQSMPFAVFIFLGVLLTVLSQGNVLLVLKGVMYNIFY